MTTINTTHASLRHVMPLVFAICAGFAGFNILLGGVFLTLPSASIKYLLPPLAWALIFVGVGAAGAYFLAANSWRGTRRVLIAGLLLKATWMFFLIPLIRKGGLGTVVLWGFLAYMQALAVIYFPVVNHE